MTNEKWVNCEHKVTNYELTRCMHIYAPCMFRLHASLFYFSFSFIVRRTSVVAWNLPGAKLMYFVRPFSSNFRIHSKPVNKKEKRISTYGNNYMWMWNVKMNYILLWLMDKLRLLFHCLTGRRCRRREHKIIAVHCLLHIIFISVGKKIKFNDRFSDMEAESALFSRVRLHYNVIIGYTILDTRT